MAKKGPETPTEMSVLNVTVGRLTFYLLGTSPLVLNAMSEKTKGTLLYPSGRKTAADRAVSLKHNPLEEYRNSAYRFRDGDPAETRLLFPGVAFKKAMGTAALDLPGMKKSQIGRLVWINDFNVPVYGVPQMFMCAVRSSDMARTPDIRTRAIVPRWACSFSVNFVTPLLKEQHILDLMAAAGILVGIGDGRQEKGTFSFGQFEVVSSDDPRYRQVIKGGGRKAQDQALLKPDAFDLETERLYSWFNVEFKKREGHGEKNGAASQKKPRAARATKKIEEEHVH